MKTEVKKLAREPLVWVGAVLLCVPMLASGSLKHARALLTFDPSPKNVVTSAESAKNLEVDPSAPSFKSIAREPLPPAIVDRDWMYADETASSSKPLPPMEGGLDVELEPVEYSPVSLPPAVPKIASRDPGSILDLAEAYQESEEKESAASKSKMAQSAQSARSQEPEPDDGFDFLFGDETTSDSKPKEQAAQQPKADSSTAAEKKSNPVASKSTQERKSESEQEPESPNWLFSDSKSNSKSQTEPNLLEPPKLQGLEGSPSPEFNGQPKRAQRLPQAQPQLQPQLQPQPQLQLQPQSEYYVELDAGPDWWTPFCQQSIWNSVPAQQTGLDAIVFSAMQNSPYVKLLNTEPQLAQTYIDEADSQFDWSAFVESSWSDTDRPVVSLLDTGTAGGRFVQQQLLFEAGVQRNLRTGGHFRVGQAWQRTDNNSIFLSPADQATAQILLDYRQPLLRGAGKHVNCSQVMLAQLSLESAQNNSQAQLQQFLVDVVSEYWELHFARGVLMQKLRCVERAEQLMSELASLPDTGSRQRDLARIAAIATARRTDLIRAKNEVATRQEQLLNLAYGSTMPDSTSLELVPVEAPGTFMVPYDLGYVTEMAVQNRAEVQVVLGAIRAAAIRKDIVLNELKPRLDAILSTFLSGVDSVKDVGGAFGDSFDNDPSYAVGFSFEMPLGRRRANAKLTRQQLETERLQHQLEQTLGNVRLDARLAWRNVSSIASELENHKLAVTQATKQLQFATRHAANGISGSSANTSFLIDDLLRSQEGLAIAESRLLRSQTDLSVALVELKRATGQLLQTAPMPNAADHYVQQASFEEETPASPLWEAPGNSVLEANVDMGNLWDQ